MRILYLPCERCLTVPFSVVWI